MGILVQSSSRISKRRNEVSNNLWGLAKPDAAGATLENVVRGPIGDQSE